MTIQERNNLVEQYIPLVKSTVRKIVEMGQIPPIEAEDLEQEGYVAVIQTIDRFRTEENIDLTARLNRRIRSAVIDSIKTEMAHWTDRVELKTAEDDYSEESYP